MAEDASTELAKGILRNIIDLDSFGNAYNQGSSLVNGILQRLGVNQPPAQAAPPLNRPLPRFGGLGPDGQPIIIPPGQGR